MRRGRGGSKTSKRKAATPGGGVRAPAVRLSTKNARTPSQKRWLERQLNDPYVAEARRLGYRSRAAFKLVQLDDRLRLLRPGARVVDLGAAPGGWTQVAAVRTRAGMPGGGKIVAIDIAEMSPVPGAEIQHLDFLAEGARAEICTTLGGQADLVLSDMAPPSTGHHATDHIRIMALAEAAADFAAEVLAPGGAFVAKVWQGGAERSLLDRLKRDFEKVRHVKPAASRAESSELYVVATGFRGVEG